MRAHENVSAFFGSGPDGGQLKQDTCKKIKNEPEHNWRRI